jgi:V8-like Glu-specific endopeptidase
MVELKSVSWRRSPFESFEAAVAPVAEQVSPGSGGEPADPSRTLRHVAVSGRGAPLRTPFESVIGVDERVRVLDTDLAPWRMICALRMRGPTGASAIGTGWFIGPRTLLTAGHCVHSTRFFGGWASSIEVVPGLNGVGSDELVRPYGEVTSTSFSSLDLWTEREDPDFDVGCIHLDEPLGDKVGWFGLAVLAPADLEGYLVNISGYPADRGAGSEQYHAANRIVHVGDRRIYYEVDTYGGQSGAPVWIYREAGAPPEAVAVHAYGTGGTPAGLGGTANSAPRLIPEVYDTVTGWIEADGGPTG